MRCTVRGIDKEKSQGRLRHGPGTLRETTSRCGNGRQLTWLEALPGSGRAQGRALPQAAPRGHHGASWEQQRVVGARQRPSWSPEGNGRRGHRCGLGALRRHATGGEGGAPASLQHTREGVRAAGMGPILRLGNDGLGRGRKDAVPALQRRGESRERAHGAPASTSASPPRPPTAATGAHSAAS
jgi:hypothetical protein